MAPKTKKLKKSDQINSDIKLVDYLNNGNMNMDENQNDFIDIDEIMAENSAQCSSLNAEQTSHQTENQLSKQTANVCQQQQQQQQRTHQLAIYSEMNCDEHDSHKSIEDEHEFATIPVTCLKCNGVIDSISEAINCGECDHWHHCACVGLKPDILAMFMSDNRFKWLCHNCAITGPNKSFINII